MEEIPLSELSEFSLQTNNLPNRNLRNRFMRWRQWTRRHPYQPILDEEAQREINADEWETEINQDEYENINEDTTIEIAEDAPLLGNTTGIATGIGVGIGGSSISAGTAAAGIGLAGAGVLAGGLYGIYKRGQEGEGYVLPNSEYIGPGNPVPVGAAKNSADQVAKDHDVEYGHISNNKKLTNQEFKQKVIDADNTAIEGFQKSYNEDGHLNAKIGEVGLRIKQNVEHILGAPLYPQSKCHFINYLCPLFQNAKSSR